MYTVNMKYRITCEYIDVSNNMKTYISFFPLHFKVGDFSRPNTLYIYWVEKKCFNPTRCLYTIFLFYSLPPCGRIKPF